MHQYKVPRQREDANGTASRSKQKAAATRQEAADEDADLARRQERSQRRTMTAQSQSEVHREQAEPLMDNEVTLAQDSVGPGQSRAYAHRDIKPGNIMVADDGVTPILMDLGSLAPSPTAVTSRSLALAVQDQAAEHSTMPYRAPELFDVKTGSVVDTKVDIWSLGCTMYACLIGKSPFEARSDETGGSLSICVLGGDWRWPGDDKPNKGKGRVGTGLQEGQGQGQANGSANQQQQQKPKDIWPSELVREVVRRCLLVEASERPDVDELIKLIEEVIPQLSEDEVVRSGA
jgi:serine/threonine kinase 16